MRVITAKPVTHQLANTYQPNMVLNQWVSMLITQSQAAMEELAPKNTRNQAERPRLLYHQDVPPSRSSEIMFWRILEKNQYHKPKNNTIRPMKKIGKLPPFKGQ